MENTSCTTIKCLPDEILTLILSYIEPKDIVRFSLSCKYFYEILTNNSYLWKIKYCEEVSKNMVKVVEDFCIGDYLQEMKKYYNLKKIVCDELVAMSPKYYWRMNDITLEDVRHFFQIATKDNITYYYTIHILQSIVRKANKYLDNLTALKPVYTLTVIYYAKIVIRHLTQTFLSVKWVRMHILNQLKPEVVLTFFLQWVDPVNNYDDDEVDEKLEILVQRVKDLLMEKCSKKQIKESDMYVEKTVLQAITQVIYRHSRFALCPSTKVKTLDIVKVINESNGNIISYAVIYHAVARKLGVQCPLIAFPNHLFLEWQNKDDPNKPMYTIDLMTGELKPKRWCPYSQSNDYSYDYFPDSLLQYLYSSYMKSKGAIRDCKTQNAIHLLDFLGTRNITHNPYDKFYPYLGENFDNIMVNTPLDIRFVHDIHLETIKTLANLNQVDAEPVEKPSIKDNRSSVIYAVGMICYHKVYNYMCVVRGWTLNGLNLPITPDDSLYYGQDQPFYRVIAGDQSERYIAQENLLPVTSPFRIPRLEDHIGKEFTHFDGFSYVPNDEKIAEYPFEQPITAMFKKRFLNIDDTP